MATDTDRLIVLFEARMRDFERQMARAQQTSRNNFKKMEAQASAFERRFATLGRNAATAFNRGLATLGVGIGFGSLLRAFNNARQMADDIVNVADRIGVTTGQLQEFHFAAVQADVDIGEFDSSLDAFAKRLGDAAKGTGDLLAVLEANNVPIRDAQGNLIGVNEQLLVYADLMANASDEVTKAALSNAAFGRGNVEMQALMSGGSQGFRDQAAAARELGGVLDDELLRETARLNDQWDAFTTGVGAQFRGLLLDVGTAAFGADGSIEDLTREIVAFIEVIRANLPMILNFAEVIAAIGIGARVAGAPGAIIGGVLAGMDVARRSREAGDAAALAGRFDDAFAAPAAAPPITITPDAAALARAAPFSFGGKTVTLTTGEPTTTPAVTVPPRTRLPFSGGGGGGGGGGGARAEADAVGELIKRLREELELIGKSDIELAIANNLREAGAAATEEQKAEIEALTRQIDSETAATDRLTESMEELGDMAGSALKGIIGDLLDGKSAAEALGNALAQIGDRLISSGIDMVMANLFGGGVAGGGILGGLFGGARAMGGPVSPGRAYLVGERGPELFVPRTAGRIAAGAGAAQPVVVHLEVAANDYFDARVGRISAGAASVVVNKTMENQREMQRRTGRG